MNESQNVCRPLPPEAEKGTGPVLRLVKGPLPDIEDLDAILEGSEKVISNASVSGEHINKMIEERAELLERLWNVEAAREQRLQRVQDYDPFRGIDAGDYEQLVSAGVIDSVNAERLTKLDDVIDRLTSLDQPTAHSAAEFKRLSRLRKSFRKQLEGQLKAKRREVSDRRAEVENKVLGHYSKRTGPLESAIAEIEADPRVSERLKALEEEEKRKLEEEAKQFMLGVGQSAESLGTRHEKVFERLAEITGNENIVQDLLSALLKERGQKQQSVFNGVRNRLIESIIDGDGKGRLKGAGEVVPWAGRSSNNPYIDTMNDLRYCGTRERLEAIAADGNTEAARLLRDCKQLADENAILRRLVGRKHIEDRETGKKLLGPFWAAFETRRQNDKDGTTAARKKKREETAKAEAEDRKLAAQILKRGGFVVTAPVMKCINGKQRCLGMKESAIRLERVKSKKNNEMWRVAEVSGAARSLEVGSTSPLNMSSFPSWLKEAAKEKFIMRGQDFVELLSYDSEE